MGFGLLPVTTRKGADEQAVRITVSPKKTVVVLIVSFSPVLFEIMGAPDYVTAYLGDGEDAGVLQIQPADEGQKVASHRGAGVVHLHVPAFKHPRVKQIDAAFDWDAKQKALFVTLPDSIAKACAA